MRIDISYQGSSEDVVVLKPYGHLDTTTAPEVEETILDLLSQERYRIIVDLQDVDYVNSSGWGTFLREIRRIRDNAGDLVLVHMNQEVYTIYETMEFSRILQAFPGMNQALEYFQND